MNKLILTLFLLLNVGSSIAQVPYTSIDFENSVWSQSSYAVWFSTSFYEVVVDGDTLINNVAYHKLYSYGITYFYDDPWQFEIVDSMEIDEYSGAIRENDQKQVLLVGRGAMQESVLFDYNLILGDTIETVASGGGGISGIGIVNQIDSVLVCGTWRNRYRFDLPLAPAYFIEGVGSSAGILPSYEYFESGSWLNCYSNNNCECGDLMVNNKEVTTKDTEYDIFPNPISTNFTVKSFNDSAGTRMTVFNLMGQIVYSETNHGTTNIDCSGWTPGVYFLTIEKNKQKEIHKMLKL